MKAHTHIIVLCESNTTFDNTHPLFLKQLNDSIDPIAKTVCISFENHENNSGIAQQLKERYPHIELVVLGNLHILGLLSIAHAVRQLKKFLINYESYEVVAHGAIAGLICKRSVQPLKCASLDIKAYGLLAAEFEYSLPEKRSYFERWFQSLKSAHFKSIEHKAYKATQRLIPQHIHTISNALREFIFNTYRADYQVMSVMPLQLQATHSHDARAELKKEVRAELNIAPSAKVFCYQGTFKSTEFAQESLAYFKDQFLHDDQCHLLILSSEREYFDIALMRLKVPTTAYHIINVAHSEKHRYLAACDVGIVLRDHNIIHWISKPETAIEFLEAGLQIAHNSTVAWLAKENPKAESFNETLDKMAHAYDKKAVEHTQSIT